MVVITCGQSHSGGQSGFPHSSSQFGGGGVVVVGHGVVVGGGVGQSHCGGQSGLPHSSSQLIGAGVVVTIFTVVVGHSGPGHSGFGSQGGCSEHSAGGLSESHSGHGHDLISISSPSQGFGHSHFLTRTEKHLGASPPTQSDQPHHSDQPQSPLSHSGFSSSLTTTGGVTGSSFSTGSHPDSPHSSPPDPEPSPDPDPEKFSSPDPETSGHSHSGEQSGLPHSSLQLGTGQSHFSVSNMSPSGSLGQSWSRDLVLIQISLYRSLTSSRFRQSDQSHHSFQSQVSSHSGSGGGISDEIH